MLIATAAPTPAPVVPAVAVAVELPVELAVIPTAPALVAEPVSAECVLRFAIVSANEPATATEAAAPELASLENVAPPCNCASTEIDGAETVPSSNASLVTFANVIPTPTPIAAEPPVADPSPFDFADAV
jgi:hypothetical protein